MKVIIKPLAAFMLFSLAAVSCQKEENTQFPTNRTVSDSVVTVHYVINGNCGTAYIQTGEAWEAFLRQMLALAREGYSVSFVCGSSSQNSSAKETVVYTTTSESDAINWMTRMTNQGYEVSISFDKTTGIYTCTATR